MLIYHSLYLLILSLFRASGSSFRKGSTAVGTWPIG